MPRGIYKRNKKNNKKVGRKKIDWRFRAEEAELDVQALQNQLNEYDQAATKLKEEFKKYEEDLSVQRAEADRKNRRINNLHYDRRRLAHLTDSQQVVIKTLGARINELEMQIASLTDQLENGTQLIDFANSTNEASRKQNKG